MERLLLLDMSVMVRADRVRAVAAFRAGAVAAISSIAILFASNGVYAEEKEPAHPREETDVVLSPASDAGFLDTPPFPGMDITNAVRANVDSLVIPEARIGDAHVTLLRPQFGLRVSLPMSDRIGLRVSGRVSTSRYRFRSAPTPLSPLIDDALDLHAARIAVEGSYWLEDVGPFWAEEELWSVLGTIAGGSRWEDGDFESGLGATGALGFGYEVPDVFRVALGASVTSSLEEGGLDFGPFVSLRWDLTDRLHLRSQGLGVQLEYELTPVIELQVTGARVNDGFRLQNRTGIQDDLTFRDRYFRFGGGFEWDLANWLRLTLEAGYTAERRLRVQGDDLGTIAAKRVDPSFFFDVGFEVRL